MVHIYNGISFDSREEVHFAMYCDELKEHGLIHSWKKSDSSIQIIEPDIYSVIEEKKLKTKTTKKEKQFTFLKGLSYTSDFEILWNDSALEVKNLMSYVDDGMNPNSWFYYTMVDDDDHCLSYVEVKPEFDFHQKIDKFSIIQKIIWHNQRLFVDLIQPIKLFEGTFMPAGVMEEYKYKKAPTGKNKGKKRVGDWKCDFTPKTLKQFLYDT